jgi:hypothetical protein
MAAPIIIPIIIGSPKIPNRFWIDSGSACNLFKPGILLIAGYDIGGILKMGINMGAVMFLMPRMVKILMEGLIPDK